MKRSFGTCLVVLALVLSGALVFAGGQAEEETTVEIAPDAELVTSNRIGNPDAPNTLTYHARATLSHESAQSGLNEHLVAAYEDWAERNPAWKIEMEVMPGTGSEAMARLLEQAAARRAPDFAMIDSFFLGRFYDFLEPLDDHLGSEVVNDYVPFAREDMVGPDGNLKALWFNTDNRVLWYRSDLVPEPPETWDELVEVASELAEEGYDGYLFAGGRGEGATMLSYPYIWMQGAELIDRDSGRPVFNEGENREAVLNVWRFLKELVDSGASPERVTTYHNAGAYNPDIATGNVAMFVHGNWMSTQIFDVIDDQDVASQYSYAPLPRPSVDHPYSTSVGGWTAGVFTDDSEKQAVIVDFLETTYTGTEGMAGAVAGGGHLPTRSSVVEQSDLPYFDQDNVQDFFRLLEEGGRPRPGGAEIYPVVSEEYSVSLSSVLAGDATPEEAIERAWDAVMRQYE